MEDYLQIYTTIFFDETDIFPDDFIQKCKNDANEAHNIKVEVKNNINLISMKQLLYAQVVILRQKDLKITEANKT